MQSHALLEELEWRGLLFQHTEGVGAALSSSTVSGYCGFDPTASSLHVGSLVPIMGLVHLQRAGHRPIGLLGGGTGLIGDPSFKANERSMLTLEQVEANLAGITDQLSKFLSFDGKRGAKLVNNYDWLSGLRAIEFMRDVGKHFTVNYMTAKESVKARIETGISYTEFSYMLLQAYDFLELYRRDGVTLQVGGSDQWGNMTAGMELIRRTTGGDAHVITFPLVTTSSGTKFGKTEAGTIWLDPLRTSPYRFYQFWLNVEDADVGRYLRFFTLLSRDEIEQAEQTQAEHPERREGQRLLASDVTRRVHDADALRAAEEVSGFFFGGTEPSTLSDGAFDILRAEAPFAEVEQAALADESNGRLDVLKLLTASGLAASNGAAKRLLEQGGVSVNKKKLGASERFIDGTDALLAGRHIILGKGKRDYALLRIRG
jgi:tyrosyl-tRNA synthetase